MSLISIIVPVFNSSQYLEKCIKSILLQSYNNFELILINDGSTDNSLEICDYFKKSDKRIEVYNLEKNKGVSFSRNIGIRNAQVEFLIFIDIDDSVGPNYLVSFLSGKKYNLVISGFKEQDSDGLWKEHLPILDIEVEKIPLLQIYKNFISTPLIRSPWCKLYRRDIIKDNEIKFDESLNFGEDTIFVLNYLRYVEDIGLSNTSEYYYHFSESSLSRAVSFDRWYRFLIVFYKEYLFLNAKYGSILKINQNWANRCLETILSALRSSASEGFFLKREFNAPLRNLYRIIIKQKVSYYSGSFNRSSFVVGLVSPYLCSGLLFILFLDICVSFLRLKKIFKRAFNERK